MRTHVARIASGEDNVVNVYVKPETLYNLQATQALTAAIMGRYGHPGCCSGMQLLFQLEEEVEEATVSVEVEA